MFAREMQGSRQYMGSVFLMCQMMLPLHHAIIYEL